MSVRRKNNRSEVTYTYVFNCSSSPHNLVICCEFTPYMVLQWHNGIYQNSGMGSNVSSDRVLLSNQLGSGVIK